MKWKEELTVKNILLVLGCIYAVWRVEIFANKKTPASKIIVQHTQDKSQMEKEVEKWKSKAEYYELLIEKNSVAVDAMDNHELDSVWAAIHR